MKGRNPTVKEKKHMDKVQQLGCIVCHLSGLEGVPAEIHHIEGKTKQNAHLKVLPLCYEHHRMGVKTDLFVSRHPFKKEFEKRYGSEKLLLFKVMQLLVDDV